MGNILCNAPQLGLKPDPYDGTTWGLASLQIRGRFQTAFQEEQVRAIYPEICEHEGKWFEEKSS